MSELKSHPNSFRDGFVKSRGECLELCFNNWGTAALMGSKVVGVHDLIEAVVAKNVGGLIMDCVFGAVETTG